MNTDISMTENPSSDDTEDKGRPKKRGVGLALLAMVLALASLCGTGWLWWQNSRGAEDENMKFAAELSHQDQKLAKLEAGSAALASQVSKLATADPNQRLTELEQSLAAVQRASAEGKSFRDETTLWTRSMQASMENAQARLAGAESRLSALSARAVDSKSELDLAEVDYLLRLAQERLALFGDTRTADRALEIADQHIAAFDNPMFLGLQREIASARQKLSQLALPDYQELEEKLDVLQSSLDALAFKGDSEPSEQPADSADSGWWARIRNAFSGLVTVRRSTAVEQDLPVLADQELIRQRAWLQLEVARWAALRRDQAAYQAALDRFSTALKRWFEPSQQGAQQALGILHELKLLNIDPPLPDISAPWAALRALRGSGVSAPVHSNPAPQAEQPPQPPARTEAEKGPASEDPTAGDDAR